MLRLPASTLLLALLVCAAFPAAAQDRPVVVLDPGHGGPDFGVEQNRWLEKDLVLRIAFAMGSEFVAAGYDVIYTRTTDVPVAWEDRRRIAEDAGADLLFMLHANRNDDASRTGAEIYANLTIPHHERLADRVGEELGKLGAAVVEQRDWPFLASPTVPTAMLELAFMSNPADAEKLREVDFHHELGRALVAAAGSRR